MSRGFVRRLLCISVVACAPAFADDGDETSPAESTEDTEGGMVDKAQSDIQRDTQRLGKSAGVKAEVLEGRGGYGSAGCGLGSVIIKPSEHFTQIFAATTNGLFGNQTFGITSGTSNCDGPAKPKQATERFIVANRGALAIAITRGRGESIEALAAVAGCPEPKQLASLLQRNFEHIFPEATSSDRTVARALVGVMQRHAGALGCTGLEG